MQECCIRNKHFDNLAFLWSKLNIHFTLFRIQIFLPKTPPEVTPDILLETPSPILRKKNLKVFLKGFLEDFYPGNSRALQDYYLQLFPVVNIFPEPISGFPLDFLSTGSSTDFSSCFIHLGISPENPTSIPP